MGQPERNPKLTGEANRRIRELLAEFRQNLSAVAETLARDHKTERTNEIHIDQAYQVLRLAGMSRLPWYKRPESETGLAGALIGLCFSVPDVIGLWWPDSPAIAKGVLVALAFSGVVVFVHGVLRGRIVH